MSFHSTAKKKKQLNNFTKNKLLLPETKKPAPQHFGSRGGLAPFKVADLSLAEFGPQGDPSRRARDAGPDGAPLRVQGNAAARGREDHGLAAHDGADGGAHRDAGRPRRRRALGVVQHFLDAGSRGGGGRCRQERNDRRSAGRAGVCVEGRDARGVLVVHGAGADVARWLRPEPAAR